MASFTRNLCAQISKKKRLQSERINTTLCHCMAAGLSQFQYIIILILGRKEVSLLAKNLNTSFLVSQKVRIGIKGKQISKTTALMQERIHLSL